MNSADQIGKFFIVQTRQVNYTKNWRELIWSSKKYFMIKSCFKDLLL